jgi:hypothetical protein
MGRIICVDEYSDLYKIKYNDGDSEDFDSGELAKGKKVLNTLLTK